MRKNGYTKEEYFKGGESLIADTIVVGKHRGVSTGSCDRKCEVRDNEFSFLKKQSGRFDAPRKVPTIHAD